MCQQMMSDLFGPFEIKDAVNKRMVKKVWGVVFCCMVSRAVNADLVDEQSSGSFLQACLLPFCSVERRVWSDRGTNFVGAKPALHELQGWD